MISDLIPRLERATGPDRKLDRDIHIAIGTDPPEHPSSAEWWYHCPYYTASLDAARSISNWVLLHASDIGADGLPLVVLGDPLQSPPKEVSGFHQSLIIAWCIAALKAREENAK